MDRSFAALMRHFAERMDGREAALLVERVTGTGRDWWYAYPEATLSWRQYVHLKYLVSRRRTGVPLAYLTGHKEFCGLDFAVTHHTLVPRAETETMVEAALEIIKNWGAVHPERNIELIDVGTGSGCIPVSITKKTPHPLAFVGATDISRGALRVARSNAEQHTVALEARRGHLLKPFVNRFAAANTGFIITANLPYLTQEEFWEEGSIHHEPFTALVAAHEGLALYEQLLVQIQKMRTKNPFPFAVLMEINPAQSKPLRALVARYLSSGIVTTRNDLCGRERIVVVQQ